MISPFIPALDSVHLWKSPKSFRGVLPQAAFVALLCASLTTFSSTVFAQEGTFVPTGNLNTARANHTATLLNNGMVLITGGFNLTGGVNSTTTILASAELYNPTTGIFIPTGNLNTARDSHTATLLNNGMVLIAGGYNITGSTTTILASAELYNPTTGIFTPTGNLNTARDSHTATLLNNGMVLIAGGYNITGSTTTILASAELYNPTTGIFTPTGNLNTARASHTATLLNNGMVLIAGAITSLAP